jgi:predicted RecB family nuclease
MFSPTSLANFLACQYLTALDRAEAAGQIKKPFFADPGLELLVKLGLAHEEKYLRYLTEEQNLQVTRIAQGTSWDDAVAKTVAAIGNGVQVIYQAAFSSQQWQGRADFLIRVEKPSERNGWSYEVVETKLARSTKARAIIQLSFYSDLLSRIQGAVPEYMHVVLGDGAHPETFSVHRYLAYFRKVQREFENGNQAQAQAQTYPEPVDHCRVCGWFTNCDDRWRSDDHLSLVAGISKNQRKRLVACGIKTVHELAGLQLRSIEGIGAQALTSIREQARLQVQGSDEGRCIYELFVPPEIDRGLCALPPPSPGDVFLDFEGDAFAFDQGVEYIFGGIDSL